MPFQGLASSPAVAVLYHQYDASHVSARDRAAQRVHRVGHVRIQIRVATLLHARAVKRSRLEELLRVHTTRVQGVVRRRLQELRDDIQPQVALAPRARASRAGRAASGGHRAATA